jgi:hypothetical protein
MIIHVSMRADVGDDDTGTIPPRIPLRDRDRPIGAFGTVECKDD